MKRKIAIEINEEYYNLIKRDAEKGEYINILERAVVNGTPLDLEGLKSDMKALNCGYPYGLDYLLECLKTRLGITIVEADKAESEDKE